MKLRECICACVEASTREDDSYPLIKASIAVLTNVNPVCLRFQSSMRHKNHMFFKNQKKKKNQNLSFVKNYKMNQFLHTNYSALKVLLGMSSVKLKKKKIICK